MTWLRLDDQFHRNPKALLMSDAAHRIYVDALSYCSDSKILTGFMSIPEAETFVRGRGKRMAVIVELVELDAWESGGDGYLIHHFEDYVPPRSKALVLEWRANKRAEWKVMAIQSPIKTVLNADSLPIVSGYPGSRIPVPVSEVLKEPSVGSLRNRLTWPDVGTRRGAGVTSLADSLPVMQLGTARKEAI